MQEKEQFTRTAEVYMDTVFRVALNFLKRPDAADDVTQNVFLRLLRSEPTFESDDHLKHWLIRVTINECKRYVTMPWNRTESLEDFADSLAAESPESADVYRLVMRLPRNYRMAVYLHYYEGYSTKEVADMMKRSQSTVCTWLERGRKKLKKMLLEDENA